MTHIMVQHYETPIRGNENNLSMRRIKDRISWISGDTESQEEMEELSGLASICAIVQDDDALLIHTADLIIHLKSKASEDFPDIDFENVAPFCFIDWMTYKSAIKTEWNKVDVFGATYYYEG